MVLACVQKTQTRVGRQTRVGGQSASQRARRCEKARDADLGFGVPRPVGLMGHSRLDNRALFSTRRLAEERAVGLPLLAISAAALALQAERVLDEPPRESEWWN